MGRHERRKAKHATELMMYGHRYHHDPGEPVRWVTVITPVREFAERGGFDWALWEVLLVRTHEILKWGGDSLGGVMGIVVPPILREDGATEEPRMFCSITG